ncbi:MAG: putative rane protein [Myxococcaceae bacterium]|nr:putative rane protein [Myxococcaceae bacterium]
MHLEHGNVRFYQPLETPGANWAAATSVALIAQQVAGKAVRDALFLTSFHAHSLPFAMATAAVLSLVAVLWLTRLMSRHSPAKVLPILFALSALGFVLEWGVGFMFPRVSAVLVYIHTALVGPALITTFWSLINERFDPHTAKRAVARIAGGGTLGGVLAGLAVWRASTLVPLSLFVLFLAALNALGMVGTILVSSRRGPLDRPSLPVSAAAEAALTEKEVSPFGELRKAPFLRNLGLLVAIGAATSTLLDYIFSAQATLVVARGAPLLYFFSLFWLGVSIVSFVLQVTLGRIALEKLGLAVSIAFLPGIIIMGGALGLAVPGLVSAALLRGGEAVQRNTLFRSAYELLYTPLAEERKRATKALIDIGFDRAGTVVGSTIAFAVIYGFAAHAPSILLGVVVLLALGTLPLARQLHVGYVTALQDSLRDGADNLSLPPLDDAARPTVELRAREKIIEHVEKAVAGQANGPAFDVLQKPRDVMTDVAELLSGDEARARRALAELSGATASSCAILLLAHKTLHVDAVTALRRVAPTITGQLLDALLDPTMDFVVRRRIPRVLSACLSQRAADGLLLGIADERFEVRYQCGRALLRITDASSDIVISRERVIAAVQRELEVGKKVLETVAKEDYDDEINPDEQTSLMEMLARDRVDRSLEHVFTILSLHLEREPLRMAFRALHHEDTHHRGTALEYLETILPAEVREGIWPYLGATAPRRARPANEILAELAAAATGPDPASLLPPPSARLSASGVGK